MNFGDILSHWFNVKVNMSRCFDVKRDMSHCSDVREDMSYCFDVKESHCIDVKESCWFDVKGSHYFDMKGNHCFDVKRDVNRWFNVEWSINHCFGDEMCMNWFCLMMNVMTINDKDFDNERRRSISQYFYDIDFDDLQLKTWWFSFSHIR